MSVVSYQMNAQSGGYSTQEPIAVPRTSLTETSSPCFSMSMVPEFNNKHVIEDRECYKNALENCSSSNLYPSSLPFSVSGTHIGWEHEISNPHKLQSFSTEEKMLPLQIEPVVTQTSSHFLETGEAWQQVLDHNRRFPSQVNPILPASMGNMAQTVEHALANGASLGNFMARQTICENQSGLYRPFGPGMDKMSNLKCSWNSTQSLELVDPSKSALVCQQRVAMINHTNPDLGFSLTSENGASLSDDRFHLIRGIRDPLNLQGTWHGDRLLTTSGCAPLESTIQIIEDGDRLSKGPSDFSFSHGGCVVAPASMIDENSALFTKMDNGIPTGNGLTNSESQDVDPEDSLSFGQIAREQGNSLSKRIKRKDISPEKQNEGPYASTPNFLREQKDLESEEGQAKRFKGAEATKDKDELRCKGEKSSSDNSGNSSPGNARDNRPPEPPKPDYIHVRARRGQATDSHSLAERVRREKISERMKFLQDLVPGCNKVTGKAVMLDEIINYVQSLQRQVEFLSMKLAAVNPKLDFNMDSFLLKEMLQSRGSASNLVSGAISANKYQPHKTLLQASMPHGVDLRSVVSMTEGTERRRSCPPSAVSAHNETAATVPTAWEGELQSIVQMGIGQNRSLPSLADSLPCHLPNINMKAEL